MFVQTQPVSPAGSWPISQKCYPLSLSGRLGVPANFWHTFEQQYFSWLYNCFVWLGKTLCEGRMQGCRYNIWSYQRIKLKYFKVLSEWMTFIPYCLPKLKGQYDFIWHIWRRWGQCHMETLWKAHVCLWHSGIRILKDKFMYGKIIV